MDNSNLPKEFFQINRTHIGKVAIAQLIVRHIRDLVLYEKLLPETRLPDGRTLSRKWNISHANVQKALAQCAREGLLTRCPRRGTVILSREDMRKITLRKNNRIHIVVQETEEEHRYGDVIKTDYFKELLLGMQDEFSLHGIMAMMSSVSNPVQENIFLQSVTNFPPDAVIILRSKNTPMIPSLKRKNIEVILVDPHQYSEEATIIMQDEDRAARDLVQCLVNRGHRSFGLLIISDAKWTTQMRVEALKNASKAQCIDLDPSLVRMYEFRRPKEDFLRSVEQSVKEYLSVKNRPSAIIINSRRLRPILERVSKNLDIRIPEDIQLAGYDIDAASLGGGIEVAMDVVSYGGTIARITHRMVYSAEREVKPRRYCVPLTLFENRTNTIQNLNNAEFVAAGQHWIHK